MIGKVAKVGRAVFAQLTYDGPSTILGWMRPNGEWRIDTYRKEAAERIFDELVKQWRKLGHKIETGEIKP